jgi:hypothetical protein
MISFQQYDDSSCVLLLSKSNSTKQKPARPIFSEKRPSQAAAGDIIAQANPPNAIGSRLPLTPTPRGFP